MHFIGYYVIILAILQGIMLFNLVVGKSFIQTNRTCDVSLRYSSGNVNYKRHIVPPRRYLRTRAHCIQSDSDSTTNNTQPHGMYTSAEVEVSPTREILVSNANTNTKTPPKIYIPVNHTNIYIANAYLRRV